MKELIWLIPVFPLAGFLVNGLVYLICECPPRRDLRSDLYPDQPAAESAQDRGHPSHGAALPGGWVSSSFMTCNRSGPTVRT